MALSSAIFWRSLALTLCATAKGQTAHPPLLTSPPLDVASTVNGYVLVSRVASLPGTLGFTSGTLELEPEEALALLGEGITQRLRALPLRLPDPNSYGAGAANFGPMLLAGSDASTKFLALPGPFEEELLDELHTYRLHRRVNRGAHGEVWRAVRSDDPCVPRSLQLSSQSARNSGDPSARPPLTPPPPPPPPSATRACSS